MIAWKRVLYKANRLDKMVKGGGQLFMEKVSIVPEEILAIIDVFPQLIVDPKGLPPQRGPTRYLLRLEVIL